MENTIQPRHPAGTPERTRHLLPSGLGAELRAARERQRLSLRGAASLAGISPGHLCLLEQGKRCPSQLVAEALITALGLNPRASAWLLEVAVTDAGRCFAPPTSQCVNRSDKAPANREVSADLLAHEAEGQKGAT